MALIQRQARGAAGLTPFWQISLAHQIPNANGPKPTEIEGPKKGRR
jgi:hypothetical protein